MAYELMRRERVPDAASNGPPRRIRKKPGTAGVPGYKLDRTGGNEISLTIPLSHISLWFKSELYGLSCYLWFKNGFDNVIQVVSVCRHGGLSLTTPIESRS